MKKLHAFPVANEYSQQRGMTLRDYFAAKAMQSLIVDKEFPLDNAASRAYEIADTMLKERNKL